jgi:hypothetical protein
MLGMFQRKVPRMMSRAELRAQMAALEAERPKLAMTAEAAVWAAINAPADEALATEAGSAASALDELEHRMRRVRLALAPAEAHEATEIEAERRRERAETAAKLKASLTDLEKQARRFGVHWQNCCDDWGRIAGLFETIRGLLPRTREFHALRDLFAFIQMRRMFEQELYRLGGSVDPFSRGFHAPGASRDLVGLAYRDNPASIEPIDRQIRQLADLVMGKFEDPAERPSPRRPCLPCRRPISSTASKSGCGCARGPRSLSLATCRQGRDRRPRPCRRARTAGKPQAGAGHMTDRETDTPATEPAAGLLSEARKE